MKVTDEMVTRFLGWKLPKDFSPDAGITFKRVYNETSAFGPQNHEPSGTNLLSADQARAMLGHVLAASVAPEPTALRNAAETAMAAYQHRFGSVAPRLGNFVGPIDGEMQALRAALSGVAPEQAKDGT